jgi:hypothetical protein
MDPKLTILFVLIGTIIAVSHFSEGKFDRMRQQLAAERVMRHLGTLGLAEL